MQDLSQQGALWKSRHDALTPQIQEYKNYRKDVSPLRRAYPQLKADHDKYKEFYQGYQNVDLGGYKDLPNYYKPLDQFRKNYQQLAQYDDHLQQFIHYYPGAKDKEFHPKKPFDVPDYDKFMPKSLAQLNDLRSFAQKNRANYGEMLKRRHQVESFARKYPHEAHNYGLKNLGLGTQNQQLPMKPWSWASK